MREAVRTKLLVLLGFLLCSLVGGFLVVVPPARGYEISIYRAFPLYFWGLVIATIFVGQLVIVRGGVRSSNADRYWIFGILLIMIVNLALLLMPLIRGYPVYGRGDVLTHLGTIRSIRTTGSLGTNVYPILHVMVLSFSYLTGVESMRIINLVPPAASLVFLSSTYLLLRELFDEAERFLFILPFSLLLFETTAHLLAVPYALSVLFVPLSLYLLVKEQRTSSSGTRAVLLVSLLFIILSHPLTALFLLLIVGSYALVARVPRINERIGLRGSVATLIFVIFLSWYGNFAGFYLRIISFFQAISGVGGGSSALENYGSTLSRTSPELIDLLELATFSYGTAAITMGLASLFLLVIGGLLLKGTTPIDDFNHPFFWTSILLFVAFTVLSVLFLVKNVIAAGFGRPLMFARFFAVIFSGLLFHFLWQHAGDIPPLKRFDSNTVESAIIVVFVAVLLVFTTILTFSVYFSPLQADYNHQVSEMELSGTEWAFEHRNEGLVFNEFGIAHYRFYHLFYGDRTQSETIRTSGTLPPDHFGYDNGSRLGDHYHNNTYLMLTRLGRITYPTKFPDYREFWRFTPRDFQQLERDPTVARLYDNGEYNQYLIAENASSSQ